MKPTIEELVYWLLPIHGSSAILIFQRDVAGLEEAVRSARGYARAHLKLRKTSLSSEKWAREALAEAQLCREALRRIAEERPPRGRFSP